MGEDGPEDADSTWLVFFETEYLPTNCEGRPISLSAFLSGNYSPAGPHGSQEETCSHIPCVTADAMGSKPWRHHIAESSASAPRKDALHDPKNMIKNGDGPKYFKRLRNGPVGTSCTFLLLFPPQENYQQVVPFFCCSPTQQDHERHLHRCPSNRGPSPLTLYHRSQALIPAPDHSDCNAWAPSIHSRDPT